MISPIHISGYATANNVYRRSQRVTTDEEDSSSKTEKEPQKGRIRTDLAGNAVRTKFTEAKRRRYLPQQRDYI